MATPLPSARHDAALGARTAFEIAVIATFTLGDLEVAVEPIQASFQIDRRRSMWWSGDVTVATADLLPLRPGDLLTPFGTVVDVEMGVRLADGSVSSVPFGRYVIDRSTGQISPSARTVALPLVDFAERIAAYRFEDPFTVAAGTDVAQLVNLVVTDRLGINPGLSASGNVIARQRIFGLDPEMDPWREMQEVCAAFGWRLHYSRNGALVLDTEPVPSSLDAVAWPGPSSVTGVFEKRPANVVVARGETSDDLPPVQAVAMDLDPLSPTWAGTGPADTPYGRRTRYYASPVLTTVAQAQLAAQSILAKEAAAGATWTAARAFDPTRDPDDVASVAVPDFGAIEMVVDSVSLSVPGETVIEGRALTTLDPEESP